MTILVMDSDPISLRKIISMLKDNKFNTLAANCPKDAINQLQSNLSIAIVLADLNTQQKDRFELLRFLRTNLRFSHIPVIICTELADNKSVIQSIELGAKDYLVKPIREEKLIPKICRILESGRGSVLVVSGNEVTLNVLVRTLQREGYKVLPASSGEQALSIIDLDKVDIIISELMLQEMTGLDLLVSLKEKNPEVMVLLILGQNTKYNDSEMIAAGADGIIKKPFKNTDIIRKIIALKITKRQKISPKADVARKLINLEVKS